MKHNKKILKAVSVALSTCMLLSACATAKDDPSSLATGDTKSEKLRIEVFDRADYPSPSTANDNPISKWIIEHAKKDLNLDVEFVPVPRSAEYDKLNAMMAGNTAPDIVFTYNIAFPSLYTRNGGLTDLTSYIDEFGPNIKDKLKDQLPLGKFYDQQVSIPAKRVDDDLKHTTYIRKDILDRYHLPLPSTKEEFYNALKVVKEKEPDLIPYAMATTSNERYYENFVMSYAQFADEKEFYQYAADHRMASPGVKDGFQELNKWYHEGLISTDFVIDKEAKQLQSDISTGRAFSFTDDLYRPLDGNGIQTAVETDPSIQYVPINAFENNKGEYFYNSYEPIGLYMMVPKANEKNAANAVRYINWMLENNVLENVKTGIDLGAAERQDSGLIVLKDNDTLKEMGIATSMFSDLGIVYSRLEYDDPSLYDLERVVRYELPHFDPTATIEAITQVRQGTGFYTSPRLPLGDEESKYGTGIRNDIKDMAARLISANPSEFDALWDTEYKSLETAGLTAIIEERGKTYDEQK